MKKAILAVAVVLVLLLCSVSPVFAATDPQPGYNYQAAKLVYQVNADGKIDGTEWDDANELVITTDDPVFLEYGRYQGGDKAWFENFKITYKIKWDENNLYILEIREDDLLYNVNADALAPWTGCGTLFFLSYANDPMWSNAYEPFWTAKGSDGKPHVALRAYLDNGVTFAASDDADYVGNWKYGATVDGTNSTFELIIPWSDIQVYNEDIGMKTTMSGGEEFRFTPIIPKVDEAGTFGQINWHDRGNLDDKVIDETDNPAELPANWALFTLVDAISTNIPEPVAETPEEPEAPADDPQTAPVTSPVTQVTAPETSDMTSFAALAFVLAIICGLAAMRKRIR